MSIFAIENTPPKLLKSFRKAYDFSTRKRMLLIYTGKVPAKRVYIMDRVKYTYF